MKKILCAMLVAVVFAMACKKQSNDLNIRMNSSWQKLLTANDIAELNLKGSLISKQYGKQYWRYNFKDKRQHKEFLVVAMDATGKYLSGRFIRLERNLLYSLQYHGRITLENIDRQLILSSPIVNGFISSWHKKIITGTRSESFGVPYDELPEVVVVAIKQTPNAGSFWTYINLASLFDGGGSAAGSANAGDGSGSTGIYSAQDGGGSGGDAGGSDGFNNNSDNQNENEGINTPLSPTDLTISFDDNYYRPAINLEEWFRCFSNIPDAGANYEITLLADLPVDDDPSINVNLFSGATGHCFLQLSKSKGGHSVQQIIGFTAQQSLLAVTNYDQLLPSKMVDNAGHKYDASITMQMSGDDFRTVLEKMKLLADAPYGVARFDCLDYALAAVNTVRTTPLVLPTIASGNIFSQISTGERMYSYLEDLKWAGGPEAQNIIIGGPLWAGASHGPCK